MEMRPPSRTRIEAVAFFAEQGLRGQEAVFENQFGSIAGAETQLVFFFAGTETLRVFFHDERGQTVGVGSTVGDGEHDSDVGIVAVGDEGLRAIQDPAAFGFGGRHAGAAGVGSGGGFRKSPGADELTRG
jgi:hypothetical protein